MPGGVQPAPSGAHAGAPPLAPAPAVRQMRRMTGVWFYQNRHGTWRLNIPDANVFAYEFKELGGGRRTGRREFTFSARGVLCRAGQELLRLESTEDVMTGNTTTVAVEWRDGAVWVRTDPRGNSSSSESPPRGGHRREARGIGIRYGLLFNYRRRRRRSSGARRAIRLGKIVIPPRGQMPFPYAFPFGLPPTPMPGVVQPAHSMGGPPPAPPQPERREAEDPRAGAPLLAPAPALRQLRRMGGSWYFVNRDHATWRFTIPDTRSFEYRYEELCGDHRSGRREFTFSPRGNLCRFGHELQRVETKEEVTSGEVETVAVEWADGAIWVRLDPREMSDRNPRRGGGRGDMRRAPRLGKGARPRRPQPGAPAAPRPEHLDRVADPRGVPPLVDELRGARDVRPRDARGPPPDADAGGAG
eukprot:gene16378-12983_t